ncbi:MAG: glycosyltransferase [Planctomycetota bacterium]|nr:glycosyltransferase [Planctomycetota bacterium]
MEIDNSVRIAFCITDLDSGGAERALVEIVTRLDRTAWEPHVICLSPPGELVAILESNNIPVECLGLKGLRNAWVLVRLVSRLRRIRPVLLQTFLHHANIVGRLAAKLARVPHVVSGIRVAEKRSRFRLRIDRWTDRFVDRHVCVGQAVAEFAATVGGLPREKLVVIPNGVDHDAFSSAASVDLHAEFGIPTDRRTFLFVGRLDPQKAPEVLLRAFVDLQPSEAGAHLLFVGDGPDRAALEATVMSHAVDDCVTFAGRRSDVPAIMAAAHSLVLPSRWEGLPNVILEAMSVGLPVIATRVEGSSELLAGGRYGTLVEVDSPTELTAAMNRHLETPQHAQEQAQAAQLMCHSEFTWQECSSRFANLYRSLLAE